MTLYLLSTIFSPILSTHRMVKVFGILALLSAVVYLHFVLRRAERSGPRHTLGTTEFDRSTENSLSDHHS